MSQDLDERMLHALGWTWDAPPPIPLAALPPLSRLIDDGRRLVAQQLAPSAPWFVNDPRLSLLLPWWRQILLDRFLGIVVVRPTAEVAWSLAVRNRFPVALGTALARAYQRHLVQGLRGLPVILVNYAALVDDPTTVGSMLDEVERIGGSGPFERAPAIEYIQPLLRRATQPAETSESGSGDNPDDNAGNWMVDTVVSYERFEETTVTPVEAWEHALLDTQRQRREAEADAEAARIRAGEAEQTAVEARATAATARGMAEGARDEAARAATEAVAAQTTALEAREEAGHSQLEAIAARNPRQSFVRSSNVMLPSVTSSHSP